MSKYDRVIREVFDQTFDEDQHDETVPFSRTDIETAMSELDVEIGNVPDIAYAYRSRRELPDSIQRRGFEAIIIDDTASGEDPQYLFTQEEQLIPVPETVDRDLEAELESLPLPVREYAGDDEQGVLTRVRYAGLLDQFTGLDTYHLQSHLRMRVRGREAELDDLYVGVDDDGTHHALAVEAKGKDETLNQNQLVRNTRGVREDDELPDSVRTLGVVLDDDGEFLLFEFSIQGDGPGEETAEMERVWRYRFTPST
mgnify:CR=1 FL=1